MDLRSRGRKLFVQYTGGSPCGPDADRYVSHASDDDRKKRRRRATTADDTLKQVQSVPTTDDADAPASTNADDYADDMSDAAASYKDETRVRRKSALISFLCDRDPTASGTSISFVGTDPDECAYFFDARSIHACPAAEPHRPGSVGPGSVFGIIVLVAVLVYLLGGIFYNRTINNARGWRQLPNYSLWAGMWSFVSVGDYTRLKSGMP